VTSPSSPEFVAEPTVVVDSVTKWFGQKVAVSDVSCSFGPGVSGLLGPNGAGKTTLLRMLVALAMPSEGTVTVLGNSLRRKYRTYHDVGLVPEDDAVYASLTARQYVEYAARLMRLSDVSGAATAALDEVDMSFAADRVIGGFSKGMRQRTKVAAALVHHPGILVLDEPLNGTDPVQRAHLISLFRRLGDEGTTVIVSSHVLEEIERMTDRVIAMVDGKLAAAGDVAAIRSAMTDIPYRVEIHTDGARRLAAALVSIDGIRGLEVDEQGLHVETEDLAELGAQIAPMARDLDVRITSFRPEDESLESVFRYLVAGR
jgi:ABC-2 type transport system ATP-binding protein